MGQNLCSEISFYCFRDESFSSFLWHVWERKRAHKKYLCSNICFSRMCLLWNEKWKKENLFL